MDEKFNCEEFINKFDKALNIFTPTKSLCDEEPVNYQQ